jgi:hypothetical protein
VTELNAESVRSSSKLKTSSGVSKYGWYGELRGLTRSMGEVASESGEGLENAGASERGQRVFVYEGGGKLTSEGERGPLSVARKEIEREREGQCRI